MTNLILHITSMVFMISGLVHVAYEIGYKRGFQKAATIYKKHLRKYNVKKSS